MKKDKICRCGKETFTGRCKSCSNKDRKVNVETRSKRRIRSGSNHPNWKGDDVSYNQLHGWVRERKKKPEYCEECNENSPFDLANISGEYKRDIEDFEWLCRRCHMKKDGRLDKIIIRNRKTKLISSSIKSIGGI